MPAPWQFGDAGSVGVAGSAHVFGDGTFAVSGSGAGIGGSADQFQFVWQPFSGDGAIMALVNGQVRTDPRAEAGVMFRNSFAEDAAYAEADVTPDGHVFFTWRNADGGSGGYAFTYANAPVWVQLARTGNGFTASYSLDGASWTPIGSPRTLNLSPDAVVGLVVSSHDNNNLSTATFSNVTLAGPGGSPGPSRGCHREGEAFRVQQSFARDVLTELGEQSSPNPQLPALSLREPALVDQVFAPPVAEQAEEAPANRRPGIHTPPMTFAPNPDDVIASLEL